MLCDLDAMRSIFRAANVYVLCCAEGLYVRWDTGCVALFQTDVGMRRYAS